MPYSTEVFFSVVAHYNAAVWPAQIVAYGLALIVLWLALRPRPGSGRLAGAVLALFWLWIGAVWQLVHFAPVNFLAPAFAALFLLQGLLFAWSGALKGRLALRFRPDVFGWTGLGLALFALVLYPALGWLADHGWPSAPLVGLTPTPTTLFTLAMLLLLAERVPLHLLALPVLWSLAGGAVAWILGVHEDLALPAAGLAVLVLSLWKNRRAKAIG